MSYYVYIITNKRNTTLYIGVTSDISARIYQHQIGRYTSFSKKYKLTKLVYVEEYNLVDDAIYREKQLKKWHREWKNNLITEANPNWEEIPLY